MKKLCSSRQTAPLFHLLVVLFLSTPAAFAWPDLATVKTGPTTASVGDTLTYSLASTNQAGTCCVQVSGACGDPVAACANLQVLALAQIDAGLTNQTVCLDGTAVFTVTASGTGLSYQWLHETNFLTGETNSSLVLTNVTLADAGLYSVIVNGDVGGPLTNSANLTVNTPLSLVNPPANQTNCPGTTAVFSIAVNGDAINYQWYASSTLLFAQTNNALVLTNVNEADTGPYTVVVSDSCGNVITNSADLVVTPLPVVAPLISTTNCAGTTATFSTTVSGSGSYSFQWFKDGFPLFGRTTTSLILTNITTADAGTYSFVVIGACGSVTNSATLTVNPATTATPLTSLVRNPGQTAVFATTASGTGPFTYTWKQNNILISGQSGNSLVLSNLTYAAEGTYSVEIAGGCNTATQSASLHINLPPTAAITAPTNGASFLAPANITVAAIANDSDGAVTNVAFYQGTNQVSQTTNGNPYLLMLTNAAAGTYVFKVVATDDSGLTATSAPVTVNIIVQPPLTTIKAMHLNLQTGLFEQTVRVSNPTDSPFDAVRVYVYGINRPLTVYNASGVTNGIPYVQSGAGVQPGSYVDFTIEYYVPVGGVTPNPTLVAALVRGAAGGSPAVFGASQHVTRGIRLANGNFLVEFVTLSNRIYYVEYSPDFRTWKPAQPAVSGNGSSIQWIDNGEPKTDGAPAAQSSRFYRVILLPP